MRFPVGNEQAHWDANPVPGEIILAYMYLMCIMHFESHVQCSEQIVVYYLSFLPKFLTNSCIDMTQMRESSCIAWVSHILQVAIDPEG
jgi:hypothetical protein